MAMTTRRKPPLTRQNTEEQLTLTVKYDYSDTYFENDYLGADLEKQTEILGKEKYKATLDSLENLELAKKGADEMLSLKDAVRKREPDDSIYKVAMSGSYTTSFKKTESCRKSENNTEVNHKDIQNTNDIANCGHTIIADSNATENKMKTVHADNNNTIKHNNTLTMFLLSLQKFKGMKNTTKEIPQEKTPSEKRDEQIQKAQKTKFMRHGELPLPGDKKLKRKRGIRPATAGVFRTGESQHKKRVNRVPSAPIYTMYPSETLYGIQMARDPTRSRRKLEKISKLEHDAKHGYVDKYEIRRRTLLALCKDTKEIDDRIKAFLKNIDDFNIATCPDNSLDKVLNKINTVHGNR